MRNSGESDMELKPRTRVELYVHLRFGPEALRALRQPAMPEEIKSALPEPVVLAFARLHKRGLGIALGTATGLGLWLVTLILVVKGGYPVGPTLGLLSQYFPGYAVTFAGAFVGLFWGFVAGCFLGFSFALLHNFLVWAWLLVIRSKAEMEQYGDFLDHM